MTRCLLLLAVGCLASCGLVGCGGSTKPDATPPAAVTDLAVTAVQDTTVTLTWTAPGDDGTRGRATAYDLRYGRFSVLTYWDIASPAPTPAPGPPGGTDSVVVTGLVQDAAYNFALRTVDEAGNWSDLSNMASGVPADHVAPATITDLAAAVLDHRSIRLSWTAPGDDGSVGLVEGYDIRYGTTPVTEAGWDTYPRASFTGMPVLGGEEQTYDLGGLDTTTTYYAAVRAYDEAGNTAGISNVVMATTPRDTIPPGAVTDLGVRLGTPVAAVLSWTAPGDDGAQGQAASYDVRYAQAPITEATWGSATRAYLTQTPKAAGAPETLTVAPLEGRSSYYFALKTTDEAGNTSGLSNVPQLETAQSQVWLVLADGSGDAPTIQAGIDSAAVNDTVLVGPGTYLENLDFMGKDIVVTSEAGPESTIIDGSSKMESVCLFIHGETRAAVVEGFTMTSGPGHDFVGGILRGGGVYCADSSPTIRGNRIVRNVLQDKGGGLYLALPPTEFIVSPLIENNLFEENYGYNGGGISIDGGRPIIRNNVFRRNSCEGDGGAIQLYMFRGTAIIEANEFIENIAPDHGGGIYAANTFEAHDITIADNLFVRNESHGNGLPTNGGGGALWLSGFSGSVVHNTMVGNIATSELYCNGSGIWLQNTPSDLDISGNIIAFGNDCGIECYRWYGTIANTIGPNIVWANGSINIRYGQYDCPPEWQQFVLVADPLFCSPGTDDYTVAANSPALTGPVLMGAFTTPGCGPAATVESPGPWHPVTGRY